MRKKRSIASPGRNDSLLAFVQAAIGASSPSAPRKSIVAIPVVTTLDALPDERCPVCAKPIEQKSGRGGKRVYCSTRCANAYHNGETAKASAKARAALK
ncbi:hypothetical protein, partial [Methylocystis sp.]|uniref:hypothetical protein n=1 Tax=Methylocystis sp. TaxID=1911079 RepID=UPI0025E87948